MPGEQVEHVDFADYLAADGTIPAEDRAQVDVVADRVCMYQGETAGVTAHLQLDRRLFRSEDEFRDAWEEDVELLESPGLAANYQQRSDRRATHFGVLLNEDGDAFVLSVAGTETTKAEMKEAAAAIVERY